MSEWRNTLRKWVHMANSSKPFPLSAYEIRASSFDQWPTDLPVSPVIQEFYRICDGGYSYLYSWAPLAELASRTGQWIKHLSDYDGKGRNILTAGRHLVWGEDSGAAPLIWDASTNRVATFWFKGGDWEPLADSPEIYLQEIFNPAPDQETWYQAIKQLEAAQDE
jgi:hypothetical protein